MHVRAQYFFVLVPDFILPICLPAKPISWLDENMGEIASVTGWGQRRRNDRRNVHALTTAYVGIFAQQLRHSHRPSEMPLLHCGHSEL